MVNPVTVNTALIVPLTGADVDTWGEDDVNPNMVAIDGMFAGAQTISVSSSNVTLTAPAGFTPTPGAGPTQSQNRLLRFTGTKTANVTVTLPIPGAYLIDNQTIGDFVLSFRGVTATEVVGTPNGEMVEIFNDGARVRFANLGFIGKMELWAGITSMPAWVAACTKVPYLICDGSTFSFSTYPYLKDILGGEFRRQWQHHRRNPRHARSRPSGVRQLRRSDHGGRMRNNRQRDRECWRPSGH